MKPEELTIESTEIIYFGHAKNPVNSVVNCMENSKSLIIFFSLLLIITGGGTVYAQTPPQVIQQEAPADSAAPQPEVPIESSTIILDNNHLSVEFVNVNFGDIIKEVGQKAGFRIEGSSSVFSKKVTTKFKDLELDAAVMRLFSLVKESNFRIDYDTKGTISKLKIYSLKPGGGFTPPAQYNTGAAEAPPEAPTSLRGRLNRRSRTSPQPGMPVTPQTPVTRPSFRFRAPGVYQAPKVPQPTPPAPTPEPEEDTDAPEDVEEIPYTPP